MFKMNEKKEGEKEGETHYSLVQWHSFVLQALRAPSFSPSLSL